MISVGIWYLIFLVITVNVCLGDGERTKDKMYMQINGVAACFRRLNATHQAGCSSNKDGSTGVIHFVEDLSDLDLILIKGTGGPYIPVMLLKLLTADIATMLKTSPKITGLVLYHTNETELEYYTHEDTCPNQHHDLEDTCELKWNKPGTGVLNYDFHFPIFYVNNHDDLKMIRDCFTKFNNYSFSTHNKRALCSLELTSFMFATTNTPTCMRRSSPRFNLNSMKLCDPMGDENIWASLFPVGNSSVRFADTTLKQSVRKDMKYIVVAARLDSTSMFHEMVPGAVNPITGIVTLLNTAHLLKRMLPTYKNYGTNVLFVLFNGESYDYIGSQRLLYDMKKSLFPSEKFEGLNETVPLIFPENISLFVELSQLSGGPVHVHIHKEKPEVRNFITKILKYGRTIKITERTGPLPPASLQTFLMSNPNMSGLVIAGHGDYYENKFYNSIYDNAEKLKFTYYLKNETIPMDSIQQYVANISGIIAKSIYEEITVVDFNLTLDLNVTLINELFNCYLLNANCTIHQAIQKKKLNPEPFNMYVGVSSITVNPKFITKLIGLTLGWLIADPVNLKGPCPSHIHSYVNKFFNMSKHTSDLNTTICFRTCMNFTEAVSPAFIIKDYDWNSNKYSSWSESIWKEFNARVFLKPSSSHEKMTIALGSLVMVLAFVLVYFITFRADILFPPPISMQTSGSMLVHFRGNNERLSSNLQLANRQIQRGSYFVLFKLFLL